MEEVTIDELGGKIPREFINYLLPVRALDLSHTSPNAE
jgi:hypothetical protein